MHPSEYLILDFETRSRCPIRTDGLARYMADPSTEVLCAAWILPGTKEPVLWLPGQPAPDFSNYHVAAWNAQFEKLAIEKLLPEWAAPKSYYCIAAHARYCGVPGSLDNASTWFGLGDKGKDKTGKDLIDKLCQPIKTGKKKGQFREKNEFPELFENLYKYCCQDDVAELEIFSRLPPWPESEYQIWEMTLRQNERGCPIDLDLCRGVVSLTDQLLTRAKDTIYKATDGAIVSPTQNVAIKKWLNEQGINVDDIGKETIAGLLAANDDDKLPKISFPPKVIEVLEARQIGAPASVKKFQTALKKEVNGRLHHNFYYAGAGATARWSGTSEDSSSVQLQNLFRGEQPELMLDVIKLADADILTATSVFYDDKGKPYSNPIKELQNATRSMLCATPGNTFLYTDLSAIEARVLRWLAKSPSLNDFVIYDNGGPDPYKAAAALVFGKPVDQVTADERQCGKVLVLSAQYGCGWVKFKATVEAWTRGKVQLTDTYAELTIKKFRQKNPEITKYWNQLEKAFKIVLAGELPTAKVGDVFFSRPYPGTVAIRLPSGRSMYYNRCKLVDKEIQYTKHDGIITKFYGGHGAENVTQAVSRDILAIKMLECEAAGMPICHHAHDQVLHECAIDDAPTKKPILEQIMTTPPTWAAGLPLASPVKITKRMI